MVFMQHCYQTHTTKAHLTTYQIMHTTCEHFMCISITTNKSRYDSLTWDKEVGIVGEATEFELSNKGGGK